MPASPRRKPSSTGGKRAEAPSANDLPFELPKVTGREKARAASLLEELRRHYSEAHCELNFRSPHELLVATILSAQTTDAGVNKVTPALFERFPSPSAYAESSPPEIEPFIRSIGLFRMKAKAVHASMKDVAEKFGGVVPRTMDELLTLRGVARKTAAVVLGNAYGINVGIPVDTHVQRLAVRLGLVPAGTSVPMIERRLMALFPREERGGWCHAGHMLIWHGRRACKARCPVGGGCHAHPVCEKFGDACECRLTVKGKPARPARPAKGRG